MKMAKVTNRVTWTPEHVEQMLALYFTFLSYQERNVPYQKAAAVRALAERQGRSKGSIEAKLMNVSAVLDERGEQWVTGYKPLKNMNRALRDQVTAYVAARAAA